MALKSHASYFLRHHVFSPRLFTLNLFNLIFFILLVAGAVIGAQGGLVPAFIGGVAGALVGVLFLGFFYAIYVLTHRDQFDAEPGTSPNGGPTKPLRASGITGGPPSVS
jgi:hypothetical protein